MTKDVLKQMLNDVDVGLKNALIRVNELVAENKALKEALAQPVQESWRESASDYERGVIDGMSKQAQSSVDKAVNAMGQLPRNFCPRCGKRRGGDVNYIHTCTPPRGLEMT